MRRLDIICGAPTMKPQYDADHLAEQLDKLFSSGRVSSESNPLIQTAERLYDAPSPKLNPEAFAHIRDTVLQTPVSPTPRWIRPSGMSVGLIALVGTVLIAMLSLSTSNEASRQNIFSTDNAIIVETETQQVEMVTPVSTSDAIDFASATEIVTEVSTEPVLSATTAPTEIPSSTPGAGTLYLEGPIDIITDRVIEIYGIEIRIDNDVPFDDFGVGDIVRVEAQLDQTTSSALFVASSIELVLIPQPLFNENADTYSADTLSGNESDSAVSDDGNPTGNNDTDHPNLDGRENSINCENPPPDHAPAPGWRAQCEGAGLPQNTNPGRGN